jgi:hypothetical protein
MGDVVFIAVALAFFGLCVLYIRWCDRIIGPDVFAAVPLDGTADTGDALHSSGQPSGRPNGEVAA